ncbi:MAG: hypothetical protein AAF633_14535 [Chloroflexota bacterium]
MWYTDLIDQITKRPDAEISMVETDQLSKVPSFLLDRLLPDEEHTLVIEELNSTLSKWIIDPKKKNHTPVIIGSIDGSVNNFLRKFAETMGWRILGAPYESSLLTLDFKTYLSFLDIPPDQPIVIPKLEKWFLRHHFGLNFLREMIQWLRTEKRTCVIGCQSWAWGYLKKTMRIDKMFPFTLTMSPKDPQTLNQWLSSPGKPFKDISFTFRNTADGQPIFSLDAEPDPFVSRLAAHTRGQPWLAREIWRESLLFHDHKVASDTALEASLKDASCSVWIKPWDESELLNLPTNLNNADLRLIHTSLIHGGISEATLIETFSANPADMANQLDTLRNAGLIKQVEDSWHVSTVKYPAIRRKLVQEGFLFDDL